MFHRLKVLTIVGVATFACVPIAIGASSVSAATVSSGVCTSVVDNATGVTMTVAANGDCVLTFATASTTPTGSTEYATRTWTVPASITSVDVFIVAGGGGGGMSNGSTPSGGGGGGGGIVVATGVSVTPSSSVTVRTGFGGYGGNCSPGSPGGNSAFGTLAAVGGGFGGGCGPAMGGPGGNAGGAHWGQPQGFSNQTTSGTASNGTNITAYGNAGGKSYPHGVSGDSVSAGGGGGGGAAAIGGDSTQPGDVNTGIGGTGGEGIANAWRTGSDVIYGAGGGGQGRGTQGVGGTNAGTGSGTNAAGNPGIDAVDETGAGGGGGYRQGGGRAGDGGSGVVIVRYSAAVPPVLLSAPTISGTKRTGETLTAARGSWSGAPSSYTYQWKRADSASGTYSNISSAVGSTYVLTDDDINKFIKVSVTATNSFGTSTAELSAATTVIVDLPDSIAPLATPAISTAAGFTFTISNYSNLYTYTVTTTSGSATRTADEVVVSGLSAGASATVTVRVTRTGYKAGSLTVVGSAVKPAVVIDIQAPVTTVAQGQASVATVVPGTSQSLTPLVTTTTVARTNAAKKAVNTTTTTAAPLVKPANSIAPPKIPKVSAGESALDVGGVTTKIDVSRANNQIVLKSGSFQAVLSGLDKKGATRSLDSDGNLRLAGGDVVKINLGGFKPESQVDVWLFSTPIRLGTTKVGLDGRVAATFVVPQNIEDGSHRIAVTTRLPNGKPATFTLGVVVGEIARTSTLTRVLIAIPITLAVGFGFLLPNRLRRRRKIRTA
jgi:hypothetical protein